MCSRCQSTFEDLEMSSIWKPVSPWRGYHFELVVPTLDVGCVGQPWSWILRFDDSYRSQDMAASPKDITKLGNKMAQFPLVWSLAFVEMQDVAKLF